MVSFGFAPHGWALCAGRTLPIASNQHLFSLLGTTYGGDGRETFGVPDMRGRVLQAKIRRVTAATLRLGKAMIARHQINIPELLAGTPDGAVSAGDGRHRVSMPSRRLLARLRDALEQGYTLRLHQNERDGSDDQTA